LLHDWKWMEFTGSGQILYAFLRPFSPKSSRLDGDISKSHANALGMPLRLLLTFQDSDDGS